MTCFSAFTKLQMSSRSAVVLFTCLCVSPVLEVLAGTPNGLFPAISQGLQQYTQTFFFFFFSWHFELYGILVPQSGIKPTLPALEVWNVKHWEVPNIFKERKRQTPKKIKEREGEREEHRSGLWSGPSWDSTSSVWVDETWAQPCTMATLFWRLTYSWQTRSQ